MSAGLAKDQPACSITAEDNLFVYNICHQPKMIPANIWGERRLVGDMRKITCTALAAVALGGCTGPIINSADFPGTSTTAGSVVEAYYSLPLVRYPLALKRDEKCAITVSLGAPVYVPDPQHRYAITYRTDRTYRIFSTDTLTVQTDSSGLLAAVNSTSENQTAKITSDFFDLAKAVGGLAALRVNEPIKKLKKTPPPCNAFDISTDIDLSDFPLLTQKQIVIPQLAQLTQMKNNNFDIKGVTVVLTRTAYGMDQAADSSTVFKGTDAIFYRPAAAYKLAIQVDDDHPLSTTPHIGRDYEVIAPDENRIFAIRLDRKTFAKFDVQLTFEHGMLTKFASNDTAEALAALEIPADIVKGIIGLGTPSAGSAAAAAPSSK